MASTTHHHELIEAPLRQYLDGLGIAVTIYRHPALHTVEQSKVLRGSIPGAHVKHLFLRDRKHQLWLITVDEDRQVDTKLLRQRLGAKGSLTFGSESLLRGTLGVAPGAVTPLAVFNDSHGRVCSVLDRALLGAALMNVHPLHNEATIALAPEDLMRFLSARGHSPEILDLDASGDQRIDGER
jgi:Ala-tRNA(Pro) deacylase